jgi:PKD repeat protein
MKKIYFKLLMIAVLALGINSMNAQCTANFSMTINSGGNVTFTSTSTGTSSNTIYYWSFGDGNNYNAVNNIFASNTYSANGTYSVYLFIYDTLAMSTCSAGIQYTLAITSATCGGNASFGQTFGPGGLTNYQSTSTGVSASSTYYWDFGDGNTNNSGTNNFVSHTYTASAVYPVTLIISDPLTSCTYSTVQNVSVTVASCSLAANFTYTLGANGLVNFASTSTGTTSNTSYYWDFGDGYYGYTGPTISHTYSTNAAYTVTLSLVDSTASFYCYDNIALTFSVSSVPCVANSNFTIAKDSSMLYTWKAFPTYSSNIVAANWSWGDATSTNGLYPSHTYSAAGVYNICLTVTVNCLSGPLTSSTCVSSNIYRLTGSAASMITINVINSSVGIQSATKDQASYSIYPNPNNGSVNLKITNSALKEIDVAVYNVMGEKVYSSVFTPVNGSVTSNIDLNYLPNGTYFVKLGEQGETKKLVILR